MAYENIIHKSVEINYNATGSGCLCVDCCAKIGHVCAVNCTDLCGTASFHASATAYSTLGVAEAYGCSLYYSLPRSIGTAGQVITSNGCCCELCWSDGGGSTYNCYTCYDCACYTCYDCACYCCYSCDCYTYCYDCSCIYNCATAGGSCCSIQYNSGGCLAGDDYLTWRYDGQTLCVCGAINTCGNICSCNGVVFACCGLCTCACVCAYGINATCCVCSTDLYAGNYVTACGYCVSGCSGWLGSFVDCAGNTRCVIGGLIVS